MNTLAEIEAAAATLSPEEIEKLEMFLREKREEAKEAYLQELYRWNGVHPLPKRGGPPVTVELVQQIIEEEGICIGPCST